MSLRNILTLPGLIFIALVAVFYILLFRYELVRTLNLVAIVDMVTEQQHMIDVLPDLVSVVFYLFIFKIIFL